LQRGLLSCSSSERTHTCAPRQAQLDAEASRHAAGTSEAALALTRQRLRQAVAAGARPLAMSGWEDLVDEAASDMERLEGRVAAAAERLIELQVTVWFAGARGCRLDSVLLDERVQRAWQCGLRHSRASHAGSVLSSSALRCVCRRGRRPLPRRCTAASARLSAWRRRQPQQQPRLRCAGV
jgi:hypothetical protein